MSRQRTSKGQCSRRVTAYLICPLYKQVMLNSPLIKVQNNRKLIHFLCPYTSMQDIPEQTNDYGPFTLEGYTNIDVPISLKGFCMHTLSYIPPVSLLFTIQVCVRICMRVCVIVHGCMNELIVCVCACTCMLIVTCFIFFRSYARCVSLHIPMTFTQVPDSCMIHLAFIYTLGPVM